MAAIGPAPDAEADWNTAPIPDLLDHLVSTHHDFLRSQLPLLIELAASREMTNGFTVPDSACATHRALIQGLRRLNDDSIEHLRLENDFLFPRVLAL